MDYYPVKLIIFSSKTQLFQIICEIPAQIGSRIPGFSKVRKDLVVEVDWIGPGVRKNSRTSNSLGFERGRSWKILKARFEKLYNKETAEKLIPSLKVNPRVNEEWIKIDPAYRLHLDKRLVEHHLNHYGITYPLPESVHKNFKNELHGIFEEIKVISE
ncbi:MAG: hypothetical protein HeimC3_50160 [Candidatus Heimdallarchaeota archaeon LC_3]|nr:MAG: hypothetical protein HeimC3_50160 [Candidatus Heimdallarchaeota archaeon LC_3]